MAGIDAEPWANFCRWLDDQVKQVRQQDPAFKDLVMPRAAVKAYWLREAEHNPGVNRYFHRAFGNLPANDEPKPPNDEPKPKPTRGQRNEAGERRRD